MTILSKGPWEDSVQKLSLYTIKICSASDMTTVLLLDWYLLGVEMNFGHVAVNFLFQLIFVFPLFETH